MNRPLAATLALLCACTQGTPGPAGAEGPAGSEGPAGPQGPMGAMGAPGAPAMLSVAQLPPGDPACPAGGARFDSPAGTTLVCNGLNAKTAARCRSPRSRRALRARSAAFR